jgi:hypothetical protein
MSDDLKDFSLAQIALLVAFACGVTALVVILVFFGILWLVGGH